ncbi:Uncharacterised protein [Streptococcus pneumoniae]|nr:Uncharacterised protein [Streptococcus pneumoniae]
MNIAIKASMEFRKLKTTADTKVSTKTLKAMVSEAKTRI